MPSWRAEKRGGWTLSLRTGHCSWTSRPPACPPDYDEVTLIGALGNGKLALFVKGINLDQFPAYVASSRSWSRSTAASSTCRSCGCIFPRPGWIRPTSTCGSCCARWATGAG